MDVSSVSSYADVYQMSQMEKPQARPSLEEMTARLIEDKDTDGNGSLSIDELSISEEAFAQADTDGNGQLDSEELTASAETIGKEIDPLSKFDASSETGRKTLFDIIAEASEETGVDLTA